MKSCFFSKFGVVFLLVVLSVLDVNAQHNPVVYGDTSSGLYVTYTIRAKDNLFSVGKMYGLRYQDIISFNKMSDVSIAVGQQLKIPITRENFINRDIELNKNFLPVVHKVLPKEGLFRIGVSYYRTPIQLLAKWNKLSGYNIKVNQEIIVGYIKPLGAELVYVGSPDKFKNMPYIPPARTDVEETTASTISQKQKDVLPEKKAIPSIPSSPDKQDVKGGVGFFEKEFKNLWSEGTKGQKNATLKATIFNSNSGWNDAKYYAMSSSIAPQTIVAITNPATGKKVYAKVLGGLPANFKNKGYDLIVSSATGAELGITQVDETKELNCVY